MMGKLSGKLKRKMIQIAAFGFSNVHISNFSKVKIYTGKWKYFCNPGLNCYSCPAATFSCPIGALQAVNGSMQFNISFYILGFLMAVGVLFGRLICGFVCPFGFLQELIAKIPVKKHRLPKFARYLKYLVLLWFVFLWPWIEKSQNLFGMGDPTFCKYICPAGLVMGGVPLLAGDANLRSVIGPIFSIKVVILAMVLIGCIFVERFFCKVLCPLGAVYGLFNKLSFYHLEVDGNACVHCGKCAAHCSMEVDPVLHPNSVECIRCGECASVCPKHAIHLGWGKRKK